MNNFTLGREWGGRGGGGAFLQRLEKLIDLDKVDRLWGTGSLRHDSLPVCLPDCCYSSSNLAHTMNSIPEAAVGPIPSLHQPLFLYSWHIPSLSSQTQTRKERERSNELVKQLNSEPIFSQIQLVVRNSLAANRHELRAGLREESTRGKIRKGEGENEEEKWGFCHYKRNEFSRIV